MKTKTNFATTSDVRNLINATMETFPKGPERDGIQTKMFNFWDNLNAGNNLPAGSDRNRFIAESKDNLNAARRTAQRLDNEGNKGCDMKVTVLASKLTGIKVGKNEMAKVEDNFYGKRVVKGIFAKARFESRNNYIDAILNLSTLVSNAESLITNKKIDAAKKVLKQAQAIVDSNPNHKELDSQGMVQFLNELKRKAGMSRIGAKAKFANGVYGNEKIAKGLSQVLKSLGFDAMASEVLSGSTDSETLRKYIRALKSKMSPMSSNERGMVLLQTLEKQLASRTGAKAKFAIVKSQGHTFRIDHFDGDEYKLYMLLDGEFKFIKKTEQPQRWIEANVRSGDPSKWLPSAYSRTGSKAKFSHLSTMLDMLDYQSANDQEDLAKKNIKGLAQSIGKLNPTKDEWLRYVKIAKSLGFSESQISGFARIGSKAKFANGGTKTASFLAKIDSKSKSMILENIAKNYGISAQAALAEVTDSEAENLLDYMTEPARSAASVLMKKYGSFARTGSKAKFAVPFKPSGLNPVTSKYRNAMYKIQNLSKALESYMQKKYAEANVFLKRIIENDGVTPEEKTRMDEFIYAVQPFMPKTKLLSSRTGVKARFAKEYILWAVPKGKTDTMYSQPIAEQLYTDAQINEAKRKATAAGWHTFRIAEMMSFEDMTNVWKGKPVKRRSSRIGAKVFK